MDSHMDRQGQDYFFRPSKSIVVPVGLPAQSSRNRHHIGDGDRMRAGDRRNQILNFLCFRLFNARPTARLWSSVAIGCGYATLCSVQEPH
jgi:hypothetical protein